MSQNQCSPLRSRSARKPWPLCPDMVLYRCAGCGLVLHALPTVLPTSSAVAMAAAPPAPNAPPASAATQSPAQAAAPPECCGAPMEQVQPRLHSELAREVVSYKVVGGFNESAVQLFWEAPEDRPAWVMLKTFTGGYFKYVPPKKVAPLVFPLSDEDAYVYCDRPVCQQCVFRCKKGFVLYVWVEAWGLIELPLDKMEGYFHTAAKPE